MYRLYLSDGDVTIGKFKTTTDDMNLIYKEFGEQIILDGLRQGIKINTQIDMFKVFIDEIHRQKRHSEKIRHSDFYMYLSCYSALYKFNKETDGPMFLKIKKKKVCNNQTL